MGPERLESQRLFQVTFGGFCHLGDLALQFSRVQGGEQDFLDFLRLSVRIHKAGAEEVSRLKKITDEQVQEFREKFL